MFALCREPVNNSSEFIDTQPSTWNRPAYAPNRTPYLGIVYRPKKSDRSSAPPVCLFSKKMNASIFFLFLFSIQLNQAYYVDHVIPAPLQDKYESVPGNRAERLEKNMRLLAVMNFMQQVRFEKLTLYKRFRDGIYTAGIGTGYSKKNLCGSLPRTSAEN